MLLTCVVHLCTGGFWNAVIRHGCIESSLVSMCGPSNVPSVIPMFASALIFQNMVQCSRCGGQMINSSMSGDVFMHIYYVYFLNIHMLYSL